MVICNNIKLIWLVKAQKDVAGEGSERDERHYIGNWRKGDSCYIVAESLAELCPAVMWKAELVSDELGYLPEEIS